MRIWSRVVIIVTYTAPKKRKEVASGVRKQISRDDVQRGRGAGRGERIAVPIYYHAVYYGPA
jgi:hypothetical protein